MEKENKKNITWTIKSVSKSQLSARIVSDQFVVGGCKWRLCAHVFANYLALDLNVVDRESLHAGWRRRARCAIYPVKLDSIQSFKKSGQIVNNSITYNRGITGEERCFPTTSFLSSFGYMFRLNDIFAKDRGYLNNGELKIVAEVEVLEVVGKLDVTEETSTIMETMEVNGFQLLSSQVDLVTHMFERHPEMASVFRSKNPNLRTGFMSLLLSLIEALRYSPHELHKDDLAVAHAALGSITEAGFKLDWLEKKLDEMSEKREKEEAGETRIREIEDELKDLKVKCSDLEAELEKEKSEVLAAKTPISFDVVI